MEGFGVVVEDFKFNQAVVLDFDLVGIMKIGTQEKESENLLNNAHGIV